MQPSVPPPQQPSQQPHRSPPGQPVDPLDPFGELDERLAGDCSAMIARLYNFLDGELTDVRRVKIMSHLEACPSCYSAYDFEAELRIVIRERCQTHVPADLMTRIQLAIDVERGQCQ
jgi:anti-sigma factor (TIGR02949 family)